MPLPTSQGNMVGELQQRADLAVSAFKTLVWSKEMPRYERECARRRAHDLLRDFADTYVESMNQIEAIND